MESYRSKSGKPYGATAYEIEENGIIIEFQNKDTYKYSTAKCGSIHIDNMISCAIAQSGLSTYVSQHRKELPHDWKR